MHTNNRINALESQVRTLKRVCCLSLALPLMLLGGCLGGGGGYYGSSYEPHGSYSSSGSSYSSVGNSFDKETYRQGPFDYFDD